jgi:hypothetical protein
MPPAGTVGRQDSRTIKITVVKRAIDVGPFGELADPWVTLAAVACATSRVRIGALVTPLSRRRVHKVARETVTRTCSAPAGSFSGPGLAARATVSWSR